jgi:hypothetical protein
MAQNYNFVGLNKWLGEHASELNCEQLEQLSGIIMTALDKAKNKAAAASEALKAADEIAKKAGFADMEDLLRQTRGEPVATEPVGRKASPGQHLRRPHLDPLDANADELFALTKTRFLPDWATRLIEAGWSLEELRWDKHKEALKKRGLPTLYDPRERYLELAAKAPKRYRRT